MRPRYPLGVWLGASLGFFAGMVGNFVWGRSKSEAAIIAFSVMAVSIPTIAIIQSKKKRDGLPPRIFEPPKDSDFSN